MLYTDLPTASCTSLDELSVQARPSGPASQLQLVNAFFPPDLHLPYVEIKNEAPNAGWYDKVNLYCRTAPWAWWSILNRAASCSALRLAPARTAGVAADVPPEQSGTAGALRGSSRW